MKRLDYNTVKWEDYFYLDETSPSGLRWARKIMSGNKYATVRCNLGDIAGSKSNQKGRPKCWTVRVNLVDYKVHRVIWCMRYGQIDLIGYVDHIDGNPFNNTYNNLRVVTPKTNSQNTRSRKGKSGVTGVFHLCSGGLYYYQAHWQGEGSKRKSKTFAVSKYGSEEAFRLACEYRTAQIALLNENGANYTERHGSA